MFANIELPMSLSNPPPPNEAFAMIAPNTIGQPTYIVTPTTVPNVGPTSPPQQAPGGSNVMFKIAQELLQLLHTLFCNGESMLASSITFSFVSFAVTTLQQLGYWVVITGDGNVFAQMPQQRIIPHSTHTIFTDFYRQFGRV